MAEALQPSPGVLSGEQIVAMGIVRVHRIEGSANSASLEQADQYGLTEKDRKSIVRPTSVDLRIGRQYIDCQEKGVNVRTRGEEGNSAVIEVPPLGAVIFSTLESISLPEDVVGRFDLKIAHALRGLVLQVGPQLEPLYEGPLYGLLINLSSETITLADDFLLTAEFSLLPSANKPTQAKRKTYKDLKHFVDTVPEVVCRIRTVRLADLQSDIKKHEEAVKQHEETVRQFRSEVSQFRGEANSLKSQRWQIAALVIASTGLTVSIAITGTSLWLTLQRSGSAHSSVAAPPGSSTTIAPQFNSTVVSPPSDSPETQDRSQADVLPPSDSAGSSEASEHDLPSSPSSADRTQDEHVQQGGKPQ